MSHELTTERIAENGRCACDVCGDERLVMLIMTTRHDVSDQLGLPPGSLERVVRHCRDSEDCLEAAGEPEHWRLPIELQDAWLAADAVLSLPVSPLHSDDH